MKYLLIGFLLLSQIQFTNAQEVAPNFVLTDVTGETHELYGYLDQGKTVVLDFYAVWCAPCQNNAAGVEAVWEELGPDGTDEIMILGIEADDITTDQEVIDYAIEWNCSNPQINDSGDVPDLYDIGYYPTYFIVCPDRSFLQYSGDPGEIEFNLTEGIALCATGGNSDHDARIFDYNSSITLCSEETTPNITLMNMGIENLTSVDIKLYLDGDLQSTTSWAGDLILYEFTDISLPTIIIEEGSSHEITIELENPNGMVDSNPEDNSISVDVEGGGLVYETNSIHFQLYFDNFPQETSWEILNSIGEVVYAGSDYQGNPTPTPPIDTYLVLPSDCYTFNIYDSVGDGICCAFADPEEGFWRILTSDEELIAEGGVFSYEESTVFGLDQLFGIEDIADNKLNPIIYPNPADQQLIIENIFENYKWKIFSLDGRVCLEGLSFSDSLNTINISNLSSGLYFVKLTVGGKGVTKKFIKE